MSPSRIPFILFLIALTLSWVFEAHAQSPPTITISQAAYGYIPNKNAAAVGGALYLAASLALFFRLIKARSWWGLCLPIGALTMAIGFFVRIILSSQPNSKGVFIVQQLLIILSPATFLAFNYILYGRFIVRCVDRHHSLIRPEWTARTFVSSDIITFIIQGGGGALEISTNISTDKIGSNILLAGLILQTMSYGLFILLVTHAHRSILKAGINPRTQRWGILLWLMYHSSLFIMIRCIYRIVEFAQGPGGYLVSHEIYFYCLDSLALLIGICIYIVFWPGDYISTVPTDIYPLQSKTDVTHYAA